VVHFLPLQTQLRQLPLKISRVKNKLEVIGSSGIDRKVNLPALPNLLRPVVVDFGDFVHLPFPFKPQGGRPDSGKCELKPEKRKA